MARKSEKPNYPQGWGMSGSKPAHYEAGIDRSVFHCGTQSAYMKHAVDKPEGFGTLMQQFAADNYLGKRMQLQLWIKTEDVQGWVAPWMRVDGKAGANKPLSFDNMCERQITGSTDWAKIRIVLDVPEDSENLAFGIMLGRQGKLWFDDVTFEVVGKEVPATDCPCSGRRVAPRNLNFEGDDAEF
jgi:hypothetical protein